jgi:ATP-dependent DNA helicase DinG
VRSAYGAVLPDYDTVIFDEAHLLEEVATLYFGENVSANQVEELARDAEKLAAKAGGPAKGGGGAPDGLRDASRELFAPSRTRCAWRLAGSGSSRPRAAGWTCRMHRPRWRRRSTKS